MKLSPHSILAIAALSIFCLIVTSARAEKPMIVAHGASIDEICRKAFAEYESKGVGTVKPLHDGGVSGDSILFSVDRGLADLGISGNSLEAMIQIAQNKKVTLNRLSLILSRRLGSMPIALITYPGGPLKLTGSQAKQIFTGQVKNWKDVGGEDLAIQLVVPNNTTATQESISKLILDGEGMQMRGTKVIEGMDKVVEFVAKNKGAVGFVTTPANLSSVNHPIHPAVASDITAVTLGEPSPSAQALMNIITKQIQ